MMKEIYSDSTVFVVTAPLTVTHGLTVEGSVGDSQQYDIASGSWFPDWRTAWVVLRPCIHIVDQDGIIEDGDKLYANTRWFVTEDSVEKEVTDGDDFGLPAGEDAGVLVVKRNASPGHPLTLRFEGEFADPRTGEIHKAVVTKTLICEGVTSPPKLTVDVADMTYYNPVRATAHSVTVHASLKIGADEVPASDREFVWEMLRDDGTWSAVGEEITDYCVEVGAGSTEATVFMSHMAERLDLRVRARYDAYGNPSGVSLDAGAPKAEMHFRRRMTKMRTIGLLPRMLERQQPSIVAEGHVADTMGIIPDAEKHFSLKWYTAEGQANGALLYSSTPVAEGAKVNLPAKAVSRSYGGRIRLKAFDRGWLRALTIDGKVLTVGGKILLVKA